MTLHIQDPDNAESVLLLEVLLDACNGSINGGGAFAFVSASGVRLLLQDATFVDFASHNRFDLIIGVDAVTDIRALNAIQAAAESTPGISPRAFLSDHSRSLFHPKLTWFKHRKGGRLITGSGNLTNGGLRSNWEGFSDEKLSTSEANAVEEYWNVFTRRNADKLLPLNDPRILEAARANEGREPPARTAAIRQRVEGVGKAVTVMASIDPVLIAEIPQSGNRWKQANFDLNTFRTFFQVRAGAQERVVFYHVDNGGAVHDPESRVSVAVKSQNYRFELDAASGLPYPTTGRPIGVFRRIATRTFYYTLVMPGSGDHTTLNALLSRGAVVNAQRMRRIVVPAPDLATVWPECPVLIELPAY